MHSFDTHKFIFRRNSSKNRTSAIHVPGASKEGTFVVAQGSPYQVELQPAEESQFEQVSKYLNSVVQIPRYEFQNVFLKASMQMIVAMKGGDITGFGAVQLLQGSLARLSPLYAESTCVAKALFDNLLNQIPVEYNVAIQVPDVQVDLVTRVMGEHDFQVESEFIGRRLHSKAKVELPFEKLFCLWNLASIYPKGHA